MSRNVRDLTAAEIDKLARDGWSDAARRAPDLGLPVSGSRNGRGFRCHPDRRIEDLVPEQMRAFAEKGVAQARDNYAKFKQAVETHNNAVEAVFATASTGASEYSTKLMEFMKDNAAATLEFAQELLAVKSPFEALELWTSHTRKQVQTLTAQAKEFAELVQRTAVDARANNVSNSGHHESKDSHDGSSVA